MKPSTRDNMIQVLDDLYAKGASPDRLWMSVESAHERGLIGCWHYQWLLFVNRVKGLFRWTRSAN